MDHHFVPQFYLRGFCDPGAPEGRGPWLWVADLKDGVVERHAPKNVGKAANYYAFPDSAGTASESIERELSRVESAAASVVRKLGEMPQPSLQRRSPDKLRESSSPKPMIREAIGPDGSLR